jgi:hypothetical protein
MTETAPLYYDEGVNGSTKFTFEVYRDSAQYVVYVRRWNAKKNTILEETRYTSLTKLACGKLNTLIPARQKRFSPLISGASRYEGRNC